MILIPEEILLTDIQDLLMNDLPGVLLEIEEQSEDGIRLPPLKYAGPPENLPVGTGLPYSLIEIEEGTYTEKDRILKNVVYSVMITLKISRMDLIWRYFAGIETGMKITECKKYRIKILQKERDGIFKILLKI